jgi:lipopolysaccharide heptosyltransferase II
VFARSETRLRRRVLGRYRYVRIRWRVLFAMVDTLGQLVFTTLGLARRCLAPVLLAKKSPQTPRDQVPSRILLVQCDHLGDALITTAMLGPLQREYPNATIEILAAPWNKEIFEACPEIDLVHVWDRNRFNPHHPAAWILATVWWGLILRRRKFDLAIDIRGEFSHAAVLWLSGATRRLGWNAGGGEFLLTDSPTFVPDRPEVESRAALLEQLGIRPTEDDAPWQPTFPTPKLPRFVELLDRLDSELPPNGQRIVLHVGAGTPAKRWPVEHWRELIGHLLFHQHVQIVLVGGPQDRGITEKILQQQQPSGVIDCTGRLSILELAGLLDSTDLLVGADSGPAHLAAAVGCPVVVLFSGTNNPRQWRPSGDQVTVVRHPVACSPCHTRHCPLPQHPCMRKLTPNSVAREITKCLPRPATSRDAVFASAATQESHP